ncbi:MAG: hypothetical protein HOE82_05755 [Gammaproteobacteria bacterium]|nr:hypothetical protein [Gammaproteobacteria bacterium]
MLARELYKDVVSGTEAKIKIRTKKSQPKTSYVKTTKKKARLGKKGRARLTQPKYKRSTTIK